MQVLRMFHRKIHPESSIAARELLKSEKCNLKNIRNESGYTNGNLIHLGGDNRKFPQESKTKDGKQYHKNQMKLPQHRLCSSNLSGKGEHWIKTDADCTYYFLYFFIKIQHPHSDHSSLEIHNIHQRERERRRRGGGGGGPAGENQLNTWQIIHPHSKIVYSLSPYTHKDTYTYT